MLETPGIPKRSYTDKGVLLLHHHDAENICDEAPMPF